MGVKEFDIYSIALLSEDELIYLDDALADSVEFNY